jgi:hypothetical protein
MNFDKRLEILEEKAKDKQVSSELSLFDAEGFPVDGQVVRLPTCDLPGLALVSGQEREIMYEENWENLRVVSRNVYTDGHVEPLADNFLRVRRGNILQIVFEMFGGVERNE